MAAAHPPGPFDDDARPGLYSLHLPSSSAVGYADLAIPEAVGWEVDASDAVLGAAEKRCKLRPQRVELRKPLLPVQPGPLLRQDRHAARSPTTLMAEAGLTFERGGPQPRPCSISSLFSLSFSGLVRGLICPSQALHENEGERTEGRGSK